ncbi:MAG: hypothetical protein ACXWPM_10350 [Bdellovibrionota bacterium]
MRYFNRGLLLSALLLTLIAPATSQAGAGFDLHVDWTSDYTIPSGALGGVGFGGGSALGELTLVNSHIGLLTGINYVTRVFNLFLGPTYGVIDIPLEFNYYPARWFVIGTGGFINFAPSPASGFKSPDYGVSGQIGFNIPINRVGIEFGAKYHYNFANIAVSGTAINPHELLMYLGLKFTIVGGESAKSSSKK